MNGRPEKHMDDALIAHATQTTHMEIKVVIPGGGSRTLHARSVRVVDVGIPTVDLLSPESTRQNGSLSTTAVAEFDEALKKLVKRGTKFYTMLRPNWALPAVLWELE
ncbi:MAG: hypothetical protein QG640_667 [Patescibacteria group bacterium]|nr:hypothetical protein [Patescibacteria group bacterium]